MKDLSSHSHRVGAALSLAIAAVIASAPVVHAGSQGPVIRQLRPNELQYLRPGELQNLQSRQRRQNFQLRQQIYREQDSQTIMRSQRMEVPVMKPRCPSQTFGNSSAGPRSC